MTQNTADKIVYWMERQREASRHIMEARALGDYYSHGYFVAWSERQALCYRQIERHRPGSGMLDGR